jgi:hypothetical protein
MTVDREVLPVLLTGLDDAWNRLRTRLEGLSQDEYLWEPTALSWTIRPIDGEWLADWADPDPEPAPITTIAWRMWHIASDCLASYVAPSLGDWPLTVRGKSWFGEVAPAQDALATAYEVFRSRISGLGEDGIWRAFGPAWGPFAESSWADMAVHALDELAHHGAEIALLRDLYAQRI